jgi:hypothetical protein
MRHPVLALLLTLFCQEFTPFELRGKIFSSASLLPILAGDILQDRYGYVCRLAHLPGSFGPLDPCVFPMVRHFALV